MSVKTVWADDVARDQCPVSRSACTALRVEKLSVVYVFRMIHT